MRTTSPHLKEIEVVLKQPQPRGDLQPFLGSLDKPKKADITCKKKSDLKLWTIAFDPKISGYPLRFGLSGNFGSIFGRVTQIFLVLGPASELL